MKTKQTSEIYAQQIVETMMEMAENGMLSNSCGCDISEDKNGKYITVYAFSPDTSNIPDTFKGVRLKVVKPGITHGQLISKKSPESDKPGDKQATRPYKYSGPRVSEMSIDLD